MGDSDKVKEEIKKSLDQRSHRQGAVTGHLTRIQAWLVDDTMQDVTKVEEQLKKLLIARSLFKDSHEVAFNLLEKYGRETKDIVKKFTDMDVSLQDTYKRGQRWVQDKRRQQQLKTDLQETLPYQEGKGLTSVEVASEGNTSVLSNVEGDVLKEEICDLEKENTSLRNRLDEKELHIGDMSDRLEDLFKKVAELSSAQTHVYELEDKIAQSERDSQNQQNRQASDMARLQDELSAKTDELRRERDLTSTRRTSSEFTMGRDSSGMGREDLSMISQVFAQSNAEMLRRVLDQTGVQQKKFYTSMNIPKPELKSFSGDITMYTSFVNRFDELVGRTEVSDTVKLNTLMQSCTGKALEMIECCEHKSAEEGYRLAREILKEEFGDSFLICQAWMDKVLDFPRIKGGEQLARYASMLKSAQETLRTLGYLTEMECTKSMRVILEKAPIHVQNKWCTEHREASERGERAKLVDLIKLISNCAKEMNDPIFGTDSMSKLSSTIDVKQKRTPAGSNFKKKTFSAHSMEAADEPQDEDELLENTELMNAYVDKQNDLPPREQCVMCEPGVKPSHTTARCFLYKDLSATERLEFVGKKKLCYMCLSSLHNFVSCPCPAIWKCRMPGCTARHHFTLHRGLLSEKGSKVEKSVCYLEGQLERGEIEPYDEEACTSETKYIYKAHSGCLHGHYVLPVIPITLTEPGSFVQTHVMLDSGATISMISKKVFARLGVTPVGMTEFNLKGIVSSKDVKAPVVDLNVKGRGDFPPEVAINVMVLDECEFGEEHVKQLRTARADHKHLADVPIQANVQNNIDMIIGQDNAHLFEPMVKISSQQKYAPYAVCTRLGWAVYGNVTDAMEFWDKWRPSASKVECFQYDWLPGVSLRESLEGMWQVDKVPEVTPLSPINRQILETWKKSFVLSEGHFQLPIPFKTEPPGLPDNYGQALSSLRGIEKRLKRDENLAKQYIAAMQKNFDKGYAELAPERPRYGYEWYNTHLAVITDRRPGKCRIVKNASLKYKNTSLNTSVHQGPNMTASLVDVSIRFRLFEVAITGDVREMYNQVRVPPEQRDCLRFLWWRDNIPGGEVIKCRMKTHMFGAIWSPAACIYSMQHTAVMFKDDYSPDVVETVSKDFYVDDWLKSIITIPIGLRMVKQLRELLWRAGFELTKFGSNKPEIIQAIPVEDRAKAYEHVSLDIEDSVVDKTLGTLWRPGEDVFGYKIEVGEKPLTRRGLLSVYSSIYDPLGFVGPFVLRAKLIVQAVFKDGGDWDEDIPEMYRAGWLAWLSELPILATFTVPRWLGVTLSEKHEYRLHVFSDASETGYGANVYMSVKCKDSGMIASRLVISKAKVNPTGHMTVSRLELTAAVMATRLEAVVRRNVEFELCPSVFWVDSTIVLAYIKHQSKTFKTFVANRVAMIQEATCMEQWRHVPGIQNVADVTSRGAAASDLISNIEWLNGPAFLAQERDWPEVLQEDVQDVDISNETRHVKVDVKKVEVKRTWSRETVIKLLNRYSQWVTIVKAICFWNRYFVYLMKGTVKKGYIDTLEFEDGTLVLIRIIQYLFITQKQVQSAGFKKLFPITSDGLYRLGGRLTYSKLTFEEKHPLMLPRCVISEMYVQLQHYKTGHAGVDRTYYEVRKRFWLLGGKAVVQKVVGNCIECQKFRKRPARQVMAPLPAVRVTVGTAPFENVGMDLFGPMVVRVGRSDYKRWCCLVTCFATRAAHIEIMPDLSTSSFIDGLCRFIARRGKPDLIITDNGTNFVGAVRELSEMVKEWNLAKIGEYCRQNMIRWQFNTPTASHHGGTWERMNRTAREMMMKLVKNEVLSEFGLQTISCLIESMLNSRPLTKLTEDSGELLPLTPNHLLLVRKGQGLSGNFQKSDTLRRKWKQIQFLADEFWRRWSREYVDTLQVRQKWLNKTENFKVGDLVLEVKENLYRMQWPLAIVIQVFPGKDGFVRSVRIKTQGGEYERPITKLVKLEFDE